MKVGVLSDIHSNCFALQAVLDDAAGEVETWFILGDIFGYYPWPVETRELLRGLRVSAMLKGNHDVIVATGDSTGAPPAIAMPALHNREALQSQAPEFLPILHKLASSQSVSVDGLDCLLVHGTPADTLNGRFYPDDTSLPPWLPVRDTVLMMGHTHHPFRRDTLDGGLVANPGSVGQPRDGNPAASWGVLDTTTRLFALRRTRYDVAHAVELLRTLKWDRRATLALNKRRAGPLLLEDEGTPS